MTNNQTTALEGFRILDFTHMLAGPMGTHQLSLMGAEVIKIEAPGKGDAMRWGADADAPSGRSSPIFVATNAAKKSVAVDLKAPGARELVLRLAKDVDVVVENFRPGVMERLGLDYGAMVGSNPDLIYCSVSGYGQNGPMRNWPAYDHVVQAVSGMATLSGEDSSKPMRVGFPLIDAATGMAVASAILAALLKRTRTRKGEYIDLSMMEVAATLMFPLVVESMATGVSPKPRGNRGFTGSPGSDTFKTQDGWIAVGANTPLQFEALCRTIGLPNLMEDPALIQSGEASRSFVQAADAQSVRSLIEKAFLKNGSEHWERILNSAHVPAARLRDLVELGKDLEETRPSAIVTLPPAIGHPVGMKTLSMSGKFVGTRANMTCPQLGENTFAVLKRAGLKDIEIAALNQERIIFLTP